MSSEKTPLTNSAARAALSYPYYGNDTGVHQFYTRRRKEQQLQCLTFVIVIAVFVMALVVAVSYSINEVADPLVADSSNPEALPPPSSLKSTGRSTSPNLGISNEITSTLSTEEWNEAVKAGQQAIASREAADALATPLPAPSPDSRHQYAVKTSLQAGKLALAGIGELAATKNIEASRTKLGAPSSIGSYFTNIWAPDGTCKEFSNIACPPSKYRNFDGTCNHPRHYGSALTPFIRKLPPVYADGVEAPRVGKLGRSLPSAREISLKVHPPSPSSNPSFTVMLAVFGQFLDHDITATALSQGTNGSSLSCCPADTHEHPECFPVVVGPGDPVYDLAGRNCMEFVRSAPAPQCKLGPRQQLNQVTSFIDGSVIYGPDVATAQSLREGQGGLMRMFKTPDNRTLLPQSTDPNDGCNRDVESIRGRYCFASGDGRANENLHLTTMHLLWARQHNRIATALAEVNPTWSDEKIYQETRRIVGAQLQHITYKEFVPIILGEKEATLRKLKPLMSGFRPRNNSMDVNPTIANSFAAAAFRFAHTLLPGLMKVTDAQKPASSYVELHRMLFNPYSLYSKGGMESSLITATSNTIQKTTTHVTSQLTKHLFEDPLSNATIPCGLDLVSLNIQRGRDHGLPGYTAWRQYCGLGKVNTFAELQGALDAEVLDQISKLYAHVDDVDLYTGALAESDKADGLVGPTFRCLIADQFTRIQEGDRFWYEVPGEPQSFTEGQLAQIRKTTLAKLICDCSDEISQIQPLVMRSVNSENPMTSCEDIPEPDLTAWKDPSSTVLKATAVEIPETWINFKEEINKTVQGIIDYFGKTPLAPGSPDWATFKNWVNKSFADIRSEISTLYPKPIVADKSPSFDTKKDMFKQVGKFNYMQFIMNKSLSALSKYLTTATSQSTTYDDWITFKNDIKKVLNDALMNATGMPTLDQKEELKKQIAAEIEEIKSGIDIMNLVKLSLIKETALEDAAASSDWISFKGDIIKAVNDAVDRIKDSSPPPGDPAWSTFGLEIKNQFAGIKNYIPVLQPQKLMVDDPTAAAYWDNFRDYLNKSIGNAVADIDSNMPAPGDPAWASFGTMIKDEFSGFKNYPSLQAKDPSAKPSKTKDPAFTAYWDDFKDSLNKSINNAVADIATKSPPPGDPAWAAFGAKIMNDFSIFKNKFSRLKKNPVLQTKETIKDPAIATFWDDFRASLNSSINSAVAKIAGKNPPPGDPAWTAFGAKIMNDFAGFKDKFAAIQSGTGKAKEKASVAEKTIPFDWCTFKTDIINSVADTVNSIKKNMPPPGSPSWATFRGQVMNGFSKIPSGGPFLKASVAETPGNEPKPAKGGAFDWVSFKNEINKFVTDIVNDTTIPVTLPPGDPKWADFGAKFAKFNTSFEVIKSDIDALRPKPEEAQFSLLKQDWMDFKEKINKSLAATIDLIKSKVPSPGDPGWVSFRDSIKDEFAALKNEINFVKSEASLKASGNSVKTIVSSFSTKQLVQDVRGTQTLPNFSSDLFSLQAKANKTLLQLKKNIAGMKLGATATVISAADWIAFKQEINDTVARYVNSFNGTQAEEWKEIKDFVKISFAELRNEIIALRNKTAGLQAKYETLNSDVRLQAKKPKDFTKDGKTLANNKTLFDWEALKSDVNATVQSLLDDIGKIVPSKTPSKTLKDSMLKAQNKFASLLISPSVTEQAELPTDWAVFVNGVNKTLNGVMKKIGALKPVDTTDLVALKNYEKEVDAFFDEVKDVVDRKKTEFEAATSIGTSVSSVFSAVTAIIPVWIILTVF